MCREGFTSLSVELALAVEAYLREPKSPRLCLNVDGAIGTLLCNLDVLPQTARPVLFLSRTFDPLAQLLQ